MKRYLASQRRFASRMIRVADDESSVQLLMKTSSIKQQLFFLLLLMSYWSTITLTQAQDTTSSRNTPLPQALHSSPHSSSSSNSPSTADGDSSLPQTTLSQQPQQQSESMTTTRMARATPISGRKRPLPAGSESSDSKTTPQMGASGEQLASANENENDELARQQQAPPPRGPPQRRKKKPRVGGRPEKDDYENDYTDQEEPSGETSPPPPPQDIAVDKKRRRRKYHITKSSLGDQSAAPPSNQPQPKATTNKIGAKKANGRDQEYYDDYEDNEAQKATSRKPPKQTPAKASAPAESESNSMLEGTLGRNNNSSSAENTTADNLAPPKQQVEGRPETLDARSPSGQLAAGLGRRISGMLGGELRKSSRTSTTTTTTTTSPSSSISATTEMPPTTTTTNRKSAVVVPTASDQIVSLGFKNATNLTLPDSLDWSNLVKVVMRSARDNHTLYTVVMNSSDLSSHPISDWSNEMPILLQRDFEKLIGKWSNIFPKDLLMEDLRNIMANKPLVSTNQTTQQLNETIFLPSSVNGSIINIASPVGSSLKPSTSNSSVDLFNGTTLENNTTDSSLNTSFPVHLITKSSFTSSSPGGSDINNQYRELGLAMSTATPVVRKVASTVDSVNTSSSSSSSLRPLPGWMDKSTLGTPPTITNPSVSVISGNNKSVEEFMKSMNEEHSKMQHNVKEQMDSLRHFIMLSSLGVVLCTTLVVALVIILNK